MKIPLKQSSGSEEVIDHLALSWKDGYPSFNAEALEQSLKLPVKKDLVRIFLNQNYGQFPVF